MHDFPIAFPDLWPCLALLAAGVVFSGSVGAVERLAGTATLAEPVPLPAGLSLEAVIEDVSRADAPAEVIGRIVLQPAGNSPFRFEVPYDAARIQPQGRYNLRVRLLQDSALVATTTRSYPVLTGQPQAPVSVVLDRFKAQASVGMEDVGRPPLTNTFWRLSSLRGTPAQSAPGQEEPHLYLAAEGNRLAGSGGCNRLNATYEMAGDALVFGPVASTRRACPVGMEQEQAFIAALAQVRAWALRDQSLELRDASGTVVLRFKASVPR